MKKKLKYLSLFAALLIVQMACNMPGSQTQEPVPPAGVDQAAQLQTTVAQTLAAAAQASPTTDTGQPSVDQPTTAPGETAAIPSDTLPPPTDTLAPTDTLTPPTPTNVPGDPKLTLGAPDFTDLFDQTYNWYPYDSATTKAEIKNGKFYYTMKGTQSSSEWTLSWPEIKDFYLEVSATTPNTCDGKDRYGLLFRAPDPSQGYLFYVSCDGQYRLALWDGSNFDILVDWTVANVINKGPNETNRLGVWVEGKKITLYINGEKLIQVEDNTYKDAGRYGFVIATANTPNFTITFDDLYYWELP